MSIPVIITLVLVALIPIWFIATYNSLIAARNRVAQCRSGICVALKQRNDMLPNLVAAAKAYMGHESDVLTRITALRTEASAGSESSQIKTGGELSSLVGKLQLTLENYPELKADRQFAKLHDSIEEIECELQAIRRTYNAAVTLYNNKIEMFPSSIVAGIGKHTREELIDIPEAERANVNIGDLFAK